MHRKITVKALTLVFFLFSIASFAIDKSEEEKAHLTEKTKEQREKEVEEYIPHHLLDSHDFSLFSFTSDDGEHVYVGFPLPVILWDNGLNVFMSSKFHHGETIAKSGENYYKLDHGKIYKTDAAGTITYDADHHATNSKPLDFSITKNVFTVMMVGLLMFFMFSRMAKAYKNNESMPKGMGRLLEPLVIYIRDDIARPNIGEKHYKRYMSYLLTVFFFIWIINLLGLTPLGINVTNNIAITFCLAIITYIITTATAKKDYWKHIFWMPGVPTPMKFILMPIELLGTFIKPFSLMIRLYANITAGHIVLMSILGMIFIAQNWLGGSLSFLLAMVLGILELLVAALQAYIFTMLSALYFGSAVEEHDHH
ncbi:F0F1 ATP synthase subunit A [Flavobacteriaceae bacterium]|nr:F0F1 ATP synthase subunit A [Flavobacteriaceae bacterium]MDB2490933.1 F0F1 ATP synthase subunit A [Flavobacteriaceae bacterium]